ncbi:lactonase family protein, partial [Lutimonas sp.]|uniref:lactonase family protein n=1 Tax=Lutimonas sp. TaxID=1872403 RepID=UPI003D9B7546
MAQQSKLLVGTYTSNSSEGVYSVELNEVTGELTNVRLVANSENPSFISIDDDERHVYVVNENLEGEITVFEWDEDKTKLIERDRVSSGGKHPCYVSVN